MSSQQIPRRDEEEKAVMEPDKLEKMEAVLELARLYSEGVIDAETYLRRRQLILDMLKTVGVDSLVYDRSSLINTFKLDQLLAENKIDIQEYIRQRRLVAHKEERKAQSNKITFADIVKLDRLHAEGRIADEERYIRERTQLVQRYLTQAERETLQELFEIDQLLAKGAIDPDKFAKARLKLTSDQSGTGNGVKNGNVST
jgi:uncharacterized protein YqgQ